MKIATAAYPLDWLENWADYEAKLTHWVSEAAENGAELLVFPEYAGMELASLAGIERSSDLHASIDAVNEFIGASDALYASLAKTFDCMILSGSAPVSTESNGTVNRTRLFSSSGHSIAQDKQIMTRFEREQWGIHPGNHLQVIETPKAKIGILICYDSEFPTLGRALADCDLILVPSCTDALSGYWRVRIGAMARALEQQCVTVMASIVGKADWSPAVDVNVGMGGIFCPPDVGFPDTGVIAEGTLDQPGWTYADVEIDRIAEVRRNGRVLNRKHWEDQSPRDTKVTNLRLA